MGLTCSGYPWRWDRGSGRRSPAGRRRRRPARGLPKWSRSRPGSVISWPFSSSCCFSTCLFGRKERERERKWGGKWEWVRENGDWKWVFVLARWELELAGHLSSFELFSRKFLRFSKPKIWVASLFINLLIIFFGTNYFGGIIFRCSLAAPLTFWFWPRLVVSRRVGSFWAGIMFDFTFLPFAGRVLNGLERYLAGPLTAQPKLGRDERRRLLGPVWGNLQLHF